MKKKFLVLSVLFGLCLWLSCRKDPMIPNSSSQVKFYIPEGFPGPYYQFIGNPLTNNGFELGRRIFYDARISNDGATPCAFCHQQGAAFSHPGHAVSHSGGTGLQGTRNAPGIFNMAWNTSYFWDGGVKNLEDQPINPMTNHVEMDETLPDIISKMSRDPLYPGMFSLAFSDGQGITSQHIFQALAQFMAVIISSSTRYDSVMKGQLQFNTSEANGYSIFQSKCQACHSGPLFSDFAFRNIGLKPGVSSNSLPYLFLDSGRMHITQDPADIYKFKTPSLRNVALTSPYMHDGRFLTLLDVLDYFDTGIDTTQAQCVTLDPSLKGSIHLTATQKNDVINFLNTLSDYNLINNPQYSSPPRSNYPAL